MSSPMLNRWARHVTPCERRSARTALGVFAGPGQTLDAFDFSLGDINAMRSPERLVIGVFQRHHDHVELRTPREVSKFKDHVRKVFCRLALAFGRRKPIWHNDLESVGVCCGRCRGLSAPSGN